MSLLPGENLEVNMSITSGIKTFFLISYSYEANSTGKFFSVDFFSVKENFSLAMRWKND
jgi:hypothetical protein